MQHTITLDNGLIVTQNFTWEMTKRKICVFMPSYHHEKYTRCSLKNIKTSLPKDDYIIIIGCDGNNQDYFGMEDQNVYFFHINRLDKSVRNSCYVRNFALKRCQSEHFFQKDGDVVVIGDFIKNCVSWGRPWRAGNIYVLDEQQTEKYLLDNKLIFLDNPTKVIEKIYPQTVQEVHDIITKAQGRVNMSTYFQYAFCAETKVMQNIGGYDEDYTYYGYEDSDIFCRLYGIQHRLWPDYDCSAIHLCHPRILTQDKINDMGELFKEKDFNQVKRNSNGWGDGIKK